MSDLLHVATRKGFFTLKRSSSGWNIDKVDFLGQNATMSLHDPRDGMLYVSLDHGHFGCKLHRSADNGQTWEECAVPLFPQLTEEDHKKQAEAGEFGARRNFGVLKEIWELVPGGPDQPGTLWAGTIPGGLFKSTDRGTTWEMIRTLWDREDRWQWFGGGKDSPGIHSISVHPQNSQHVSLAISCGGVWVTEDGGKTWEARTHGMRAAYMPPEQAFEPNAQDPHRMVQCPAAPDALWVQHHNGIFHSKDAGRNWTEFMEVQPSVFGFAVVVHPQDPNRAWFVPGVKDECRVPVEGRFCVTRTKDGGKTFETLRNGLPTDHCYDVVFRHGLDIDNTGNRLAMGSSTGGLWISENGGDNWQSINPHLPQIYSVRFSQHAA